MDTQPHLAAEWHPSLNTTAQLSETATNSGMTVWWLGACGHAWDYPVGARVRTRAGCPYCSGHRTGYGNDLATLHPQLASEWHPERNGDLTPSDVVPGSSARVWWRASCGHQWRTFVFVRSRGSGCPACAPTPESRQQTDLELALLIFVPGLGLRDRAVALGERLLQCDMVWPGRRLVIEYDGSYWHRHTTERDIRKAKTLREAGWVVVRVREQPLKALHPYDVLVAPVDVATSYHPGCSPARAAQSETERAHRNGGDNGHLDSCIGHRDHPSMPADHAAAPGNSKIPDRVKLVIQQHFASWAGNCHHPAMEGIHEISAWVMSRSR